MEWGAGHAWDRSVTPGCSDSRYGCFQTPYEQQLPQEFDNLKSFGFNYVRLLISWANLEPLAPNDSNGIIIHHWNYAYLDSLDMMITQFSNRGIGVLISMHQWTWSPYFTDSTGSHGLGMPVWLYNKQPGITQTIALNQFFVKDTLILPNYSIQHGYIDAWKEIVERYKNNPTVFGVDLFNEPPDQINFSLRKFYDTVGTEIQFTNPKLILIFQDGVNGKFKLTGPPDLQNSIYSFHMYPKAWLLPGTNQPSAKEQVVSHLDSAKAWNVPMLIGEFGQFGFADSLGWQADMETMLSFCRQNKISWAFYAYQHWKHPIINNGQVNDTLVSVLNFGMDSVTTNINEMAIPPFTFKLFQNYPNPFNPVTTIEYSINQPCFVSVKVYNILGEQVANLLNVSKPAGDYKLLFNTSGLSSGVYIYRIKAGNYLQSKKMILLK